LLQITEHIGVRLTQGYMMDPEGSVSALVFHHPEAQYFRLSQSDIERLERELAAEAEGDQAKTYTAGASSAAG
jgi:hypothetical protein